ncbi:MAG: proline dehydrogenase family protein [Betaproteobacteria bacterium]|nr:proline dehydrogenase family protein [Betaproteobacteria bacterium]
MNLQLEAQIIAKGKEFFRSISGEAPSIFDKGWWTGKVMDWAMKNEDFKVQLFRFVDVMPYLNTPESLLRHIREYFSGDGVEVPAVLKFGASAAGFGGTLAGKLMGSTIRSQIEGMGRQFIIGENVKEAMKGFAKLRKDGFAFTIDLLGEAAVSEEESDAYAAGYHELVDFIAGECRNWSTLPGNGPYGDCDWGTTPKVNVSIKPSALYSQAKPADQESAVERIYHRIAPLYRKIKAMGGFLCIDMEQLKFRDITIALYKRLRSDPEFRDYPHMSIVLQAYLTSVQQDVEQLIAWAKTEELPIAIRLVKGAYWDYETLIAKQCGWPIPVWTHKPESDIAYEKAARTILENSAWVYFACASHNVRTISAVMETAKSLGVPEDRYEFQVLYGMAEPVRKGLLHVAGRVRLYCPYGDLIPGMAYLVRRLLENTANESFLRQSFADGAELERLLENPEITLKRELEHKAAVSKTKAERLAAMGHAPETGGIFQPFVNEPMIDLTLAANRQGFVDGIALAREKNGRTLALFINGRDVATAETLPTTNPAKPSECIANVCQASCAEIDAAIAAAKGVFQVWRDTPPEERALYLHKAAAVARRRIFELAAMQVLEVGKQWDQAYHDVGEGIDFLEYYARDILRLAPPRRMGRAPGEWNHLFYQPKGIAAVISPWNFPFAIAIGMVSAAIVTGNPVVFKPSSIASAIGYNLVEIFKEVGLPPGVFNYCPGRSSVMGDYLIEHPDISLIAFTGSMDVGLRIVEKAAKVQNGQQQVKRVIAEMGGKNAIIIDDDADLDEAIIQVVYSAFGFQGQKCSACSRVIVLDAIYDKFIARLKEAAKSIDIGPAENPQNSMGPVADASLQGNILNYIAIAESEGRVLVKRNDLPAEGCYVPLLIVEGITPEHRIAQEEVFGPLLAVMRAKNFDQALDMAMSTRFALTGAVFSRSPNNLEKARKNFRVGNLYLNRGTTGAMVERQPFGGFMMSGVGSKTGGPDYLMQFLDPRVVTENTMRRGFTPIAEDDDWV